jgi:hypothetical protein
MGKRSARGGEHRLAAELVICDFGQVKSHLRLAEPQGENLKKKKYVKIVGRLHFLAHQFDETGLPLFYAA